LTVTVNTVTVNSDGLTDQLLAVLRSATGSPSLAYAGTPVPLTGGFWAELSGLPTFVEIEGSDEVSVRQAAVALGLDYSGARFGSVDEIYISEVGRDILAEPTLLFSAESNGAAPGANKGG
jgi:hypothetical protein